ncbi:hypothetical protein [Serratia quinivorans]|uniref:hypothetical protein n=1 Tax=Serratia quinivorans TaxID=137545 RepID=UPI00217A3BCD|nr:hypothetical protein [Serratia quinivorans]CAI0817122.1 Uncharacterised protein [Serratia quinivorans]
MNNKLTANQTAYLRRAMTEGNGLIEIGELAKSLGKQKGHIIRKLEGMFPQSLLSKMETKVRQRTGFGERTVSTYMLDRMTAGALAMSYDGMLGIEVLTILEEAVTTINKADEALKAGDHEAAQKALSTFREERIAHLQYKPEGSEADDRRTALALTGRRSPVGSLQS